MHDSCKKRKSTSVKRSAITDSTPSLSPLTFIPPLFSLRWWQTRTIAQKQQLWTWTMRRNSDKRLHSGMMVLKLIITWEHSSESNGLMWFNCWALLSQRYNLLTASEEHSDGVNWMVDDILAQTGKWLAKSFVYGLVGCSVFLCDLNKPIVVSFVSTDSSLSFY